MLQGILPLGLFFTISMDLSFFFETSCVVFFPAYRFSQITVFFISYCTFFF